MSDGELRRDLVRDQPSSEGRLLVGRVRVGLWILLGGTIWFGLIEFLLDPGRFPPVQIVRLVHISIVLAGFWLLRQRGTPGWATMVALFVAVSTCIILAIVGIATHVTAPPLLLFVAYVLGAAALLPWGAVHRRSSEKDFRIKANCK